jgi:hypothetical protein
VLPAAERRGDLQGAQQDWRIPGDDRADDAERLPASVTQNVFAERDRFALQFAGKAAKVAEDICR